MSFESDQAALFAEEEFEYISEKDLAGAITDENDEGSAPGIDITLNSLWVTQENGEQLHIKHFAPQTSAAHLPGDYESLPGLGRRVFMLHGEAESGRVFYDSKSKGLAWYLAHQGYEVFVADLGGRGRSLVPDGDMSTLSVQQIIHSAIPKLLQAIANKPIEQGEETYFGCGADIWVGHGFGTVMLSAAWASMPDYLRTAQQMIFFSGRRRVTNQKKISQLFSTLLGNPLMQKWVSRCNSFPAKKLGIGSANESVGWYANYLNWMTNPRWLGEDGIDYARTLLVKPLPPILHLAAQQEGVCANLRDARSFINELGPHDARLMVYDKIGDSSRSHNHLSMLLDESAEHDIFPDLADWLQSTWGEKYAPEAVKNFAAPLPKGVQAYYTQEEYDPTPERAFHRDEFQFA